MADICNTSKSLNYIAGNKIFILGTINKESTAELIGRLGLLVESLEPIEELHVTTPIINPYNIKTDAPIIDVYINSGGGDLTCLYSISVLLDIARTRGALVRTSVIGRAASAASMLAVQGTPGLRIMHQHTHHFVHYGTTTSSVDSEPAAVANSNHDKHMTEQMKRLYMSNTNLSRAELNKLFKAETGFIYPDQCLEKGLCDWVLMSNGKFKRR